MYTLKITVFSVFAECGLSSSCLTRIVAPWVTTIPTGRMIWLLMVVRLNNTVSHEPGMGSSRMRSAITYRCKPNMI